MTWALKEGGDYKVFRRANHGFKYVIVDPAGWVITVASTLWGARRAIRKDRERRERERQERLGPHWWDEPIVYREDP